jgi:hypothetical protein
MIQTIPGPIFLTTTTIGRRSDGRHLPHRAPAVRRLPPLVPSSLDSTMRPNPFRSFAAPLLAAVAVPIPDPVVDEVRASLPVSVVATKYVKLQKCGREFKGLSPFAAEKTPSFFVNDQKRRWFDFSSDQDGDIFALVMKMERVDFREAVIRCAEMAGIPIPGITATPMLVKSPADVARVAAEREQRRLADLAKQAADDRFRSNMAKAIASDSAAFRLGDGSAAALFLEGRGLHLPADVSPRVLRFHRACPFSDDNGELTHHPALIAIYRDIHTDAVRAISRRPLTIGGQSLKKPVSLGPTAGTAAKLCRHEDISHGLFVTESVTSGLGALMLGHAPLWALPGKTGVANFPVLAAVDHLGICGDNDINGGGQTAANTCLQRWHDAGREHTRVLLPETPGTDFADVATANLRCAS